MMQRSCGYEALRIGSPPEQKELANGNEIRRDRHGAAALDPAEPPIDEPIESQRSAARRVRNDIAVEAPQDVLISSVRVSERSLESQECFQVGCKTASEQLAHFGTGSDSARRRRMATLT
jgi:hypothetical protein